MAVTGQRRALRPAPRAEAGFVSCLGHAPACLLVSRWRRSRCLPAGLPAYSEGRRPLWSRGRRARATGKQVQPRTNGEPHNRDRPCVALGYPDQ
jgi:hypothetical protein